MAVVDFDGSSIVFEDEGAKKNKRKTVFNQDVINIESESKQLQSELNAIEGDDLAAEIESDDFGNPPKKIMTPAESLDQISSQQKKNAADTKFSRASFAVANLGVDIMNANSQYKAIDGQAKLNIQLANNSIGDALSRGATKKLERESQGVQAGESALVKLAAQGQDVHSASASRVQSSQEAVGIYNGMLEEINASREALGFEIEKVQLDFTRKQAKIQRDISIIGSTLKAGAKVAPVFF